MNSIIKKVLRLIVYSIKGDIQYSFSQFNFTNALYSLFLHFKYSKQAFTNKKAVVFNLEKGDLGRYIFSLINSYNLCEYDIYLIPNYSFYKSCSGLYIFEIFKFLNTSMFFCKRQLKKYDYAIFISDIEIKSIDKIFKKNITIDYKLAFKNHPYTLPFPFHPLFYINNRFKNFDQIDLFLNPISNTFKKVKIGFAGQINHPSYSQINRHFPDLINRNRIFEILFKNFKERITDKYEKCNNKIFISDSNVNSIPHKDWPLTLATFKFFIAPPGFEMPFCHNVIEAMACGVIPILQYDNYFVPQLKTNINCLTYKSEEDLINTINFALKMDTVEIERLRNNVLDFYSKYLSPISFIKKIEKHSQTSITISIISGKNSLI